MDGSPPEGFDVLVSHPVTDKIQSELEDVRGEDLSKEKVFQVLKEKGVPGPTRRGLGRLMSAPGFSHVKTKSNGVLIKVSTRKAGMVDRNRTVGREV
jgi:hypothetical protein